MENILYVQCNLLYMLTIIFQWPTDRSTHPPLPIAHEREKRQLVKGINQSASYSTLFKVHENIVDNAKPQKEKSYETLFQSLGNTTSRKQWSQNPGTPSIS